MSVSVSAPGKAFLIGEYAVLEGAPAIVTAVDVRAVAHARSPDESQPPLSAVVRCAHARVSDYLAARGETTGDAPVVNTGRFTLGPRKLGLGSSAAVTAAVVGYHLAQAGLDPHDPAMTSDVLALAMAAHAEAQGGGGSGADVAAAVLGGTLRFCDGEAEPIASPRWLQIAFVDAGQPAVTSSFVAAVKAGAAAKPDAYREAIARLRQAAAAFADAFGVVCESGREPPDVIERRFAAIRAATVQHVAGLRALQALSGAPIITPAIDTILALAAEAGIAAKPSGAGGGDLVLLMHPDRSEIDRIGERLRREHGIVILQDIAANAPGLRAENNHQVTPTGREGPTNSRLAGFFRLSVDDRRAAIAKTTGIPLSHMRDLDPGSFDVQRANHMIENVIGTLELPLAIATNFQINGIDVLVPMCVEEASVVAAASNAAKMIRAGGGFSAYSDPPWMIAQIQLVRTPAAAGLDPEAAVAAVAEHEAELLALADAAHPRLLDRGGGARRIETRVLDPSMIVVHVLVDCRDAMGANLLNTVAEIVAPRLEAITGYAAGLRILSNLADRRCAHVTARIPPDALAGRGFSGPEVVTGIVSASRFAELDPYRATTHNKGIMNGVDAVVLATGNDWRAMESSAHAYAARDGRYRPLAIWRRDDAGSLVGTMSLPAAVGVVGGATRVHPVARLALEILGCRSSAELGQVMAAAGLASNLAALRAMATEGISRGHMSLHARSIALGAGAQGPEIERLSQLLIADGEIKPERAAQLLASMRDSSNLSRSS